MTGFDWFLILLALTVLIAISQAIYDLYKVTKYLSDRRHKGDK